MASQPHINQLLEPVQLESVLTTFLQSRSVKLLRVIAATGRSKVAWLYYECNLTGRKRATFVSFADLIRSFYQWLECLSIMSLAFWERISISKAVTRTINLGDTVYRCDGSKLGTVVKKDLEPKRYLPRIWVDWQTEIVAEEPCFLFPF